MLGHQFAYSSAPIRKVKEVQFGILSPEEIVSPPLAARMTVTHPPPEGILRGQDRAPRGHRRNHAQGKNRRAHGS
jgi:hypothetical protein